MEVTEIPPGIISSHKALLFGIPLDHASTAPAVRPCLEQARTCVADLEDLIKLCNENLPLLRTKPAIFQRTSNIIERARGEIAQVCQLLERMMVRPGSSESYNDRDGGGQGGAQIQISFKNRWGRLSTDARNLINHEQPLVAKEHGAVVGELNFVRQLVLIAPTIVKGPGAGLDHHGGGERRAKTTVWDNMGLLDEIIGGGGGNRNPSRTTEQQQRQQTYVNSRSGSGDYLVLPPPYPGTPGSKPHPLPPQLRPSTSSLSLLSNVPRPSTNASSTTLWSPTTDPAFQELPAQPTSTSTNANAHIRPNLSQSSSSSTTIFDQAGVGLLYGDGHGHTKSSSLTSTSTSRSELPELGPGPLTATSNTLIYNQHTHNHNYQCYHHDHHHNHNNNHDHNRNHNQMGGMMTQQRQPEQHNSGGHNACNCAWEKSNSNVRVVTAINQGQPQELSSVVFAPEPVELP